MLIVVLQCLLLFGVQGRSSILTCGYEAACTVATCLVTSIVDLFRFNIVDHTVAKCAKYDVVGDMHWDA